MPTCPHCSGEAPRSAASCPSCGRPFESASVDPPAGTRISRLSNAALYLAVSTALFLGMAVILFAIISISPASDQWDRYGWKFLLLLVSISPIAALLSIVFGWMALRRIKHGERTLSGDAGAWAGLIVGSSGMLPYLFVLGLWLLGAHGIFRSRDVPYVTGPGLLRTLNRAAEEYRVTYHRGYPESLSVLGGPRPASSSPNAQGAGLIDDVFASGRKGAMIIVYKVTARDANSFPTAYEATTTPVEGCSSRGRYCYFTDETNILRIETDHMPDRRSTILSGP